MKNAEAQVLAGKLFRESINHPLNETEVMKKRIEKSLRKEAQREEESTIEDVAYNYEDQANCWTVSDEVDYCHDLLHLRLRKSAEESKVILNRSYHDVLRVLSQTKNLRIKIDNAKDRLSSSLIPSLFRTAVLYILEDFNRGLTYRKNSALQSLLLKEGALPNRVINLKESIRDNDKKLLQGFPNKEYRITINPHK